MANSRFGYVRNFEDYDRLLPSTFSVVRIDGQSFHRLVRYFSLYLRLLTWFRFSDTHQFVKPNDKRALECMNSAAQFVMEEIEDVTLAFGESDEFRWVE